jgi:hypothetical protein
MRVGIQLCDDLAETSFPSLSDLSQPERTLRSHAPTGLPGAAAAPGQHHRGARARTVSSAASLFVIVMAVGAAGGGLAPACQARLSGPPADAGADADADAPVDAVRDTRIEATIRQPTCAVASTICVGNEVHECVAQLAGQLVEVCPDVCSFGRCTSSACLAAEQGDGVHGCRFYPVQVDNIDGDDGNDMMLILSNASAVPANVVLEVRSAATGWQVQVADVVPAGGAARMVRNRPAREPGVTQAGAFRLTSDAPIMVAQLVSSDAAHDASSSGGTILLPVHALTAGYLAVTFQQIATTQVTAVAGSRSGAGTIAIVATVDHTTVHLSPNKEVLVADGTTIMPGPIPHDVVLDEGDVAQLFSVVPGDDLSGSAITADHPIEVLSGNTYTSYGHDMSGLNGADLAIEQVPPTSRWAKSYVGAWLSPQQGCDGYFEGKGSWQVIAADDDTNVTLLSAAGTAFDPPITTFRLGRGMSHRFLAYSDGSAVVPGVVTTPDFLVQANRPILLAQWLDCEPGLSFGVDARLQPGETLVSFPPGFDHQLVLVRRGGTAVTIDGKGVPDTLFHPVLDSHEFELARLSGDDLGPCADLSEGCARRIAGDAVGVTWRGMDVVCSYSLTVPSADACLLEGVNCNIP